MTRLETLTRKARLVTTCRSAIMYTQRLLVRGRQFYSRDSRAHYAGVQSSSIQERGD